MITKWKHFSKSIRNQRDDLLTGLSLFKDPVLVIGCQRSGTTILSRIITKSEGMVNYWFGKDDELDAALVLSEVVKHQPQGRYCFQVTYLNAHYSNLFKYLDQIKVIWILRNPFSVVYSMVYHWKAFALNELFENCGKQYMVDNNIDENTFKRINFFKLPKLYKAIFSYNARIEQALELQARTTNNNFFPVNYEDLIQNKKNMLRKIFDFINVYYEDKFECEIKSMSMNKFDELKTSERKAVEDYCMPVYEHVCKSLFPLHV